MTQSFCSSIVTGLDVGYSHLLNLSQAKNRVRAAPVLWFQFKNKLYLSVYSLIPLMFEGIREERAYI